MATPASTKDVAKAINAYIQSPVLPLPDDLNQVIAAYLERHEKYDDAAADRLQEELTSIYNKFVNGRHEKYAPFLAVLRQVRPALRTPARIVKWWDRFLDPVLENLNIEKGLANEALKNILQLLAFEEADYDRPPTEGPNIFADRLLSRWMQLNALNQAATGSGSSDSKERFMQEAIMTFGKKDAKGFLIALNNYFVRKEYRNRCLNLLCEFVQSQPPHLHLVLQTPLFESILKSLQYDDSTTTVSLGLVSLFMLLPNMPSSLVPYLPTLFNIYARLLFWDRDRSFAAQHSQWGSETKGADPSWDKCLFDNDLDGNSIHHLSAYFTILYGLYPINFLDYIRKPQRYLRHANNAEDIDVQATEIRERSERFRRCHLLHPNFYHLTIESEKTDFSRWIKSEPAEVITDCMNLCVQADFATGPDVGEEMSAPPVRDSVTAPPDDDDNHSGSGIPLLSSPVTGSAPHPSLRDLKPSDPRHTSIASSSTGDGGGGGVHLGFKDLARRTSQSSHPSTRASLEARPRDSSSGDSPTIPPTLVTSPSHSQLQDMINSNKVIKTGLHQSLDNASVPSLALSHADSTAEQRAAQQGAANNPTPGDPRAQVAVLQRQNLLLQNDLNFERYMKQQHMAHIGELRRRMLREAATEAETQNLIMANRSLKHQLSETKRGEARAKREGENRRNMAAKWEAQLSGRLRQLREEQKRWAAEEEGLRRGLEEARGECEVLRRLVAGAEAERLRAQQDGEAFEVRGEEIRRLKEEVARLAASERRYQGLETQMRGAVEEAAGAEARAEERLMEVKAREERLRQEREGYEREIEGLRQKVAELERRARGAPDPESGGGRVVVESVFQTALANLQAKHAELQRQFAMLKRKYTVAQSSLLDLQVEAQEKKNRAGRSLSVRDVGEVEGVLPLVKTNSSPVNIRTRGTRGLSDPEAMFEATSYNATAPLEPVGGSLGTGSGGRPSTPTRGGQAPSDGAASPQGERYYGRGGVQNSLRKEQKKTDGKKEDKKEKKAGAVIRNFRNLV